MNEYIEKKILAAGVPARRFFRSIKKSKAAVGTSAAALVNLAAATHAEAGCWRSGFALSAQDIDLVEGLGIRNVLPP